MRIRRIIVTALPLVLSACATSWDHPQYVDQAARKRQFAIDDSLCARVGAGAAPMPEVPSAAAPPQSTSGTLSVYDHSTGRYSSYSYQDTSSPTGSFASGMAQGLANGAALGAMLAAKRDRERIHDACMYRLGWVEGPIDRSSIDRETAPPSRVSTTTAPNNQVDEAIAQVPRLAYLRRVSPQAFNEVAAIDAKMRTNEKWRGRPLVERFESATQAYETIYGKVYLPNEPAPNDSPVVKERQSAMEDFARVIPVARARGDGETEKTAVAHIQRIERQIWDLRQ